MSPRVKVFRKSGDRLAENRTRREIILFIAENQPVPFQPLHEQIEEKLGLTTTKPIRDPLNALIKDGIVHREPYKQYAKTATYLYSISNTFHALKWTYDFMTRTMLRTPYMRSKHYKEYLTSHDFQAKLPYNLFKENMLHACYEYIPRYHLDHLKKDESLEALMDLAATLYSSRIDELPETIEKGIDEKRITMLGSHDEFREYLENAVLKKAEAMKVGSLLTYSRKAMNVALEPGFYTGILPSGVAERITRQYGKVMEITSREDETLLERRKKAFKNIKNLPPKLAELNTQPIARYKPRTITAYDPRMTITETDAYKKIIECYETDQRKIKP